MGRETLGPMDQTRLSHLNKVSSWPLRYPPEPVNVITGKKAALATPICAFAEASWRSASATSGLRSSNSLGRPAGISGGVGFHFSFTSESAATLNVEVFSTYITTL